jgi:transcriptional regulator GlxA family with amidase domain
MDRRIFHLKEQLPNNLQHQWTVKEMAKICKLSVPHFQKLFKSHTGMPPIAYLSDLRLEKALDLLETTFLNIQEIRIKVGMFDDSHFTQDFKKRFGVTPTTYREQYKKKFELKRRRTASDRIRQ